MTIMGPNMPAPGVGIDRDEEWAKWLDVTALKADVTQRGFNVLNFGAKGGGVIDDTVAIQAAVDKAKLIGGTVFFPPDIYLVKTLKVYPGITLLGYGAVLIRPDHMPNFTNTLITSTPYSDDVDSAPLVIQGLTIDGNRANQGAYTGGEQGQSMLCLFYADRTKAGRLRLIIEDCVFKECVSDGIHIWYNVDVTISNCRASNCWRGGLVSSGGYSKIKVTNFDSGGDVHVSGIDLEPDASGYGGTYRTDISISNAYVKGDFDVMLKDGAYGYFTNIVVDQPPFYLQAPNSHAKFVNCKFARGSTSSDEAIYFPKDVTFINCEFVAYKKPTDTDLNYLCLRVYMVSGGGTYSNQRLQFENCSFSAVGMDTGYTFRGIETAYTDLLSRNNVMELNNTYVSADITTFLSTASGHFEIYNLTCNAYRVASLSYAPTAGTGVIFRMGGRLSGSFTKYLNFGQNMGASGGDVITHDQVIFESTQNQMEVAPGVTITNGFYRGNRIIYGDAAPSSQGGLPGDIYRLRTPKNGEAYEWICITAHPSVATWKMIKQAGVKRDTTANRPTPAAIDIGLRYLDTTLGANGLLIIWQGTKWVKSDGTDA